MNPFHKMLGAVLIMRFLNLPISKGFLCGTHFQLKERIHVNIAFCLTSEGRWSPQEPRIGRSDSCTFHMAFDNMLRQSSVNTCICSWHRRISKN